MEISQRSPYVGKFAKKHCSSVTKARRIAAKLVSGIGLGKWPRVWLNL